jgi:hypothetical protein
MSHSSRILTFLKFFSAAVLAVIVVIALDSATKKISVNAQTCDSWGQDGGYYHIKDAIGDASGVYIVGSSLGSGIDWHIEKRDLDGTTIWSKVSSSAFSYTDEAIAVASYSSAIYVAGFQGVDSTHTQWRIEKRDSITGNLITSFGTNGVVTSSSGTGNQNYAYGIAADSSGIYVVGANDSPGNTQWRIEKRDLTSGALITSFGTSGVVSVNPSGNSESATGIKIDSSGIYVVGNDFSSGGVDIKWRIEKRNLSTGALITSFGTNGVVISNPSSGNDGLGRLVIDSTSMYLLGFDSVSGSEWRIEKRDLTSGALVTAFGTNGVVTDSTGWYANNINIDSTGIYMVGGQSSASNYQWVSEKRDLVTGALVWSGIDNPGSPSQTSWGAWGIVPVGSAVYIAGNKYDQVSSTIWSFEKRDGTSGALVSSCFIDIGLRIKEAGQSVPTAIAIEPVGTNPMSQLRIAKNNIIYGIALVDPGTTYATNALIRLAGGITKALRIYVPPTGSSSSGNLRDCSNSSGSLQQRLCP